MIAVKADEKFGMAIRLDKQTSVLLRLLECPSAADWEEVA